ncbi:hypothetical protein INR49_032419 [Caranx melampygus]|nr:hypothetical protein INR49_032419 [Caranx melampygus]
METLWDILEDRQKEDMSKKTKETEHATQDMEEGQHTDDGQRSEVDEHEIEQQVDRIREVTDDEESQFDEDGTEASTMNKLGAGMKRVISEIQGVREMLRMVREDAGQRERTFAEEKSQTKWKNFQDKKKRRKLEQWQEKVMKERDELEIMKIKMDRQREEVGQKVQDLITAVHTMAEMNANIEKAVREINYTQEEMLRAQRQMEKNKKEVKVYMDKLTSIKAQVNRWMLTETVKKSKLHEPQKETRRKSLKDQTLEIPADEQRPKDEITQEAVSLQQTITLEDQHEREEIKEQEQRQFEVSAVDVMERQNIFLQMQTEIHEETLEDEDQTERIINERQRVELEKQISKLKQSEEEIKEQIKYAMENVEEKNQEIQRLITDINDLQSQRPETEAGLQIFFRESENVTEMLQETEYTDSLWVISLLKQEMTTSEVQVQKEESGSTMTQEEYDESQLMKSDDEKQRQEPTIDLQTQAEEMDEGFDKTDTGSSDIQRLRSEMCRTQEMMRLVKVELKHQPEKMSTDTDHRGKENETDGLIQEMKQFQVFLKEVQSAMRESEVHLEEEMSNLKRMKTAAKKQKRELDQRLERTLRERDELDILKMKIQHQREDNEQKQGKMSKVMSAMEKIAMKTRKKSEDIQVIMKETQEKQRQLEKLNYEINSTKHDLDTSYHLISRERANLQKLKNEIGQKRIEKIKRKMTELKLI